MNEFTNNAYLVVTDYVPANSGEDVSDKLQQLIEDNPNRTLFFPDGEYLISKPILTPADPKKSVALKLATYAKIKAAPNWTSEEAMVRLGAEHPANDIYTCGSNYSLTGGIIDGSGIASGISIDGGRETMVRDVSIKHTRIGLHIKFGANSGSSDCDIFGVNIIGNGKPDSIGVLLEGFDNTLTNMRIARVFKGVVLRSQGNSLRNIHPLYTCDYTDYTNSCGFYDESGSNWYNFCYSDHFGIGFHTNGNIANIYDSCFTMWYCGKKDSHVAFDAEGEFNSVLTNFKVGFNNMDTANVVLRTGNDNGHGVIERLFVNQSLLTDDTFRKYLTGDIY